MRSWSRASSVFIGTGLSLRNTVWSLVSVRTMRSSTAVGLPALRGRLTSIPRCMSGAVSMKIRSSTRITSTSGMMLISDSEEPIRDSADPLAEGSSLNAIFDPRGLGHRPREQIQEVEAEALHLRGPVLHPVHEE